MGQKSTSAQSDDSQSHVQVARPSDHGEIEVKAADPMEVRRQQRIKQKNYGRVGANRGSLSMEKKTNGTASVFVPPPVPSDVRSGSRSGPPPAPAPAAEVALAPAQRGRAKSKHM